LAQQKQNKKVGRPKLPKGEAKRRIVPVRFTAGDLKTISRAAKANKQTVSEWIRSTVMSRNEEAWYALCPASHIVLFDIDNRPNQHATCPVCGGVREMHGIEKGYVSHEERNRGFAASKPLGNPESTPSPKRL
jgi:hypothetical protein